MLDRFCYLWNWESDQSSPGSLFYRIFFTRTVSTSLENALAGGTKRRQQQDITAARERWQDYKDRKKHEER
jgi:putative component of toxin-antitoxin plasmid stabilization module